ncbi:LAQU0S08e02608g1_1 [Lachancea quebecensis]|uniref:LAQU0S08e02608g1_1 n=1 Tax=Lachancea quebecensis TaxID=1654605 RepID=A0A0P1KZY7_9SACH|nr:LAQU0S08e02608g1_1 [Lachancea quebecensis]
MEPYKAGKRSSISFGSYQRPVVNFNQNELPYYAPHQLYSAQQSAQQSDVVYPCRYEARFPLYAMDWSNEDYVAVGSYKEDTFNKLQILRSSDLVSWEKAGEENCVFPISRVQWGPNSHSQQLATCSDSLRLWNYSDFVLQEQLNLSFCRYNKSGNQGSVSALGQLPPVSSFHWNPVDPNLIISSSIDTTCTVWDLQATNYVKTQLIAHDSEVFDVKFLTQSTQLFASCGGDGSVRVFDLRSLAHSTIIYEPSAQPTGDSGAATSSSSVGNHSASNGSNALLRLEPSPFDPNVVATFAHDSNSVLILDMRYPGAAVLTLEGHIGAVNQIQWHPSRHNVLLTCGDDCQALLWDLNTHLSAPASNAVSSKWNSSKATRCVDTPQEAYSDANYEINNIVWRPQGDWFGCNLGRHFQSVRV